jgi:hypothetical protein
MLTGRRTFEVADGWGGQHPWDVPTFVATRQVPDGWPPRLEQLPLHPMKAIAQLHPVRLDRARAREEELRSGTPSAHRESSIDATCIHHLIVKESGWTSGSKRDLHELTGSSPARLGKWMNGEEAPSPKLRR